MNDPQESALREAVVFTRAVENVFRKLIRLLLGKMTLVKLQEMIRIVFVEEAEAWLQKETPGKNVPLTKLALVTGLDTRHVTRVKKKIQARENRQAGSRSFIRDITPEASVLDYWSSNSVYQNKSKGTPLEIDKSGPEPSFEALVKSAVSIRGITPASILKRLVRQELIEPVQNGQKLKLKSRQFIPLHKERSAELIELAFSSVGNLIETFMHNSGLDDKDDEERFFQRSNWNNRVSFKNIAKMRAEIRAFLVLTEKQVVNILEKYEEDEYSPTQTTAGVGIYYFEE